MLEKKYIKEITSDNVVIPDQDAIAKDIDWDFANQFNRVKKLYPDGGYTIILKPNKKK